MSKRGTVRRIITIGGSRGDIFDRDGNLYGFSRGELQSSRIARHDAVRFNLDGNKVSNIRLIAKQRGANVFNFN